MPKSMSPPRISERGPRPVARIETPEQQLKAFSDLRRLRSHPGAGGGYRESAGGCPVRSSHSMMPRMLPVARAMLVSAAP